MCEKRCLSIDHRIQDIINRLDMLEKQFTELTELVNNIELDYES